MRLVLGVIGAVATTIVALAHAPPGPAPASPLGEKIEAIIQRHSEEFRNAN